MLEPTHLGDGAYASDDGFGIIITANDYRPANASDIIYIDAPAIENLKRFIKQWEQEHGRD